MIVMTNSIFENLKYSDYAISVLFQDFFNTGALYLVLINPYYDKNAGFQTDDFIHVRITNCTFPDNFRAFISQTFTEKVDVRMEFKDTVFINNEIEHDGGAVAQYASFRPTHMNFTSCHFYGNKAGIRPFNTTITIMNKTPSIMIDDYEFVSDICTELVLTVRMQATNPEAKL